jgi:tRNA(Ile)-lysidine synthase
MNIGRLKKGKLYLIALSGGADSVALAMMMKEQGCCIRALHCNFHLRGEESDRDEVFVRDFCQKNNICLEVKHFKTWESAKQHCVSIEMEVRDQRYKWFKERALALGAEGVCVAHHMDDQAETILMNLIRGTGVKGLAGMHPERIIEGMKIIRPLLGVTKKELLNYLAKHNQEYVTDSTNLERDALRNRIRLDVIPLLKSINPSAIQCMARTAENLLLELEAETTEKDLFEKLSELGFTRTQIIDIHEHTKKENINKSTGCLWKSGTHTLLINRGETILKKRDTYPTTCPQLGIEIIEKVWKPTAEDFKNKRQAFINADKLKGTLIVRKAMSGDRFKPFGMKNGTKLLSDYLTDKKVNLLDKKEQFVVVDSITNKIVWLIGQEIDNEYRITPETNKIIKLYTYK